MTYPGPSFDLLTGVEKIAYLEAELIRDRKKVELMEAVQTERDNLKDEVARLKARR